MPLSNDFIKQFATPGDAYRPHIMWFWNAPLGVPPQDDHAAWQCVDESGKATVFHETPQNGVCPFAQWSPFCWGQEGYGDVSDPETVRAFIELTHEAYRSRFPGELGKTIAGLFTDEVSYCLAGFYGESERPVPWYTTAPQPRVMG
jgi:hypothetical protein